MSAAVSNKVTVLGAGVVGMSTAIAFAEAGFQVEVFARDYSPNTTSDLAGALWYPSHAQPREHTRQWALVTLNEFMRVHAEEGTGSGIRLVTGFRHFYRQIGYPWWRNHVPHFRILSEWERPERARTSYEYTVPLLDMPVYLGGYLKSRLLKAGGLLHVREFQSWEQVLDVSSSILINCSGLGSYQLLSDLKLYPVRGQILESTTYIPKQFNLSADHPEGSIYVIPRSRGVLVGGGSRSGVWDTEVDEAHSEKILRVAQGLDPQVKRAETWNARVGLRPGRKIVRCEPDSEFCVDNFNQNQKLVFHNYGHTGAGVTLSWGCATETLKAVQEALRAMVGGALRDAKAGPRDYCGSVG